MSMPDATNPFDGWILPYWLDRQLDPDSPSHLAGVTAEVDTNRGARSWTALGTLESTWQAVVDPRGAVTSWPGRWSLDWWVGTGERWHHPSREIAVRQRLVESAPVVETAMRVPGGDVVHRAYAARLGGRDVAIVEVDNETATPVTLALVVRPWHAAGRGKVQRIELEGDTVLVDGAPALVLPRPPARVAVATGAGDDVVSSLVAESPQSDVVLVEDPDGMATAAFVFPLLHRTNLRIGLLPPPAPARRWRLRRGSTPAPLAAAALAAAAGPTQVAAGWRAHATHGVRLTLPDDRLSAAIEVGRAHLLARAVGADQPRSMLALDRFGHVAVSTSALQLAFAGARPPGAGAVVAAAEHWRLQRDLGLVAEIVIDVADVAERLARPKREADATGVGWRRRALVDAADVLDAGEEHEAARDARRALERVPVEATDDLDVLESAWLLDGAATSITDQLRLDATGASADPLLVATLGLAELRAGDRRALTRLAWLLDAATPTWTWPRWGELADGHDPEVGALVLLLARDIVVRDDPEGLALCTVVPDEWLGQPVEVHDAPTRHGLLSFAVRWHGERPAILWERTPHDEDASDEDALCTLTAPGLDASWSSTERSGEALLEPVPTPGTPVRLSRRP